MIANLPTGYYLEKAIEIKDHESEVHEPFVVVLPRFPTVLIRSELVAGQTYPHAETNRNHEVRYLVA